MRYRTEKHRIGFVELTYLLIGALLLLLMGVVAKGQSPAPAVQTVRAHSQNQQPLYAEYRVCQQLFVITMTWSRPT